MREDAEARKIRATCSALCLPNRERAYDVACALKFAEEKADKEKNRRHRASPLTKPFKCGAYAS